MSGGVVCLQGGAEFGDPCRSMDAEVLRRAGDGPVVVVALAARPGSDHDSAVARAVGYYRSLGAGDVSGAPDARVDAEGARAAVRAARVVVLPGGSPGSLLRGLRSAGLDVALSELLAAGGSVSGASAGAMVLCSSTVLPEGSAPVLADGLGVLPRSLALPHFSGDLRWLDALGAAVPPDVLVLGLPECAGVLVEQEDGRSVLTAVGSAATRLLGSRAALLQPGTSAPL